MSDGKTTTVTLPWEDHDWDFEYLALIVLWKLRKMQAQLMGPDGVADWTYDQRHKDAKAALELCIAHLDIVTSKGCSSDIQKAASWEKAFQLIAKHGMMWWD